MYLNILIDNYSVYSLGSVLCNIPLARRKYWRVWFHYSIVKNDMMYSKNRLHHCNILANALNNNRLHSAAQEQNSQYSTSQNLTPQCFNEQEHNPKHCTTLEQNAQYWPTQQYCTVDYCYALFLPQLYCTLFYCTALFSNGSYTATFIVIYLLASYH